LSIRNEPEILLSDTKLIERKTKSYIRVDQLRHQNKPTKTKGNRRIQWNIWQRHEIQTL